MDKEEKAEEILKIMEKEYPEALKTSLLYRNPFQLLIATVLSAQCTDKRVNTVTEKLFRAYPTPKKLSKAKENEIEKIIKSTGFYHNKARFIKEISRKLYKEYNSEVPKSISELTKLPGVGRKTANVVLSNAFGINQGIAVDTHVKRLSKRIGLTENDNPEKIERDLLNIISRGNWRKINTLLIAHGREICTARNPNCDACIISELCTSAFRFR